MAVRIEGIYTLLRHLDIQQHRMRDEILNAVCHTGDNIPDFYDLCGECGREYPVWHDCG